MSYYRYQYHRPAPVHPGFADRYPTQRQRKNVIESIVKPGVPENCTFCFWIICIFIDILCRLKKNTMFQCSISCSFMFCKLTTFGSHMEVSWNGGTPSHHPISNDGIKSLKKNNPASLGHSDGHGNPYTHDGSVCKPFFWSHLPSIYPSFVTAFGYHTYGSVMGYEATGWWFGTFFYFPIYWVANHPNWLSYFSEGWLNHQPGHVST